MPVKTKAGFGVCCPRCGALEAALTIDINDIGAITCGECSEEFTAAEACEAVAEQLARWRRVEEWLRIGSGE
jgi:transcription elongation factor Elf1